LNTESLTFPSDLVIFCINRSKFSRIIPTFLATGKKVVLQKSVSISAKK